MNKKQRNKEVKSTLKATAECLVITGIICASAMVVSQYRANVSIENLHQQCLKIQEGLNEDKKVSEKNEKVLEMELDEIARASRELEKIADAVENPDHYIQTTLLDGVLEVNYVENGRIAVEALKEIEQFTMEDVEFSECLQEIAQLEEIQRELEEWQLVYLSSRLQTRIGLAIYCLEETISIAEEVEEIREDNISSQEKLETSIEELNLKLEKTMQLALDLQQKEEEIADLLLRLEATEKEKSNLSSIGRRYADCSLVELLARLGNGEGSICSDEEMQEIMQVALNRVQHSSFENSLIGVIFEDGQYTCTLGANYSRNYSQRCIDNAVAVLEGNTISEVPDNVIWQSQEKLGKIWKKAEYHYFCY